MGPTGPPFPACHTQHCSNSGTWGGPWASSSSSSTWELIKNWNSLSRKTQTNECVCVWRGTIEKHKKHIERHRQSHTHTNPLKTQNWKLYYTSNRCVGSKNMPIQSIETKISSQNNTEFILCWSSMVGRGACP